MNEFSENHGFPIIGTGPRIPMNERSAYEFSKHRRKGQHPMKISRLFPFARSLGTKTRHERRCRPDLFEIRLEERAVPATAPYIIPLELVNISPKEQAPVYKLGIYIGLGGGTPKLYEFDTGGKGFWAAYSAKDCDCQWWGRANVKQKGTLKTVYSSGNVYKANLVSTTVTFFSPGANGEPPSPVVSSGSVEMAQITQFYNTNNSNAAKDWNKALKDGEPPLFGNFYGDFGASLQPIASSKGTNIYSILPQIKMPAGLDVGFVVHVGAIDGNTKPYLQIGIDPTNQPKDITQLKMNTYSNPSTNEQVYFPVTNVNAYSEQVANATFEIRDKKLRLNQTFINTGWTIDTGAPISTIWQAKYPNGPGVNVKSGFFKTTRNKTEFRNNVDLKITANSAIAGQPGFKAEALTGTPFPKIPLFASRHSSKGPSGWNYVNTGFWTFTQYDISFNLSKGYVGFTSVNTVAVGDVDADNYDDIIVPARAGREPIITALSGRDIVNGVANPSKIFSFVAGGTAKEGVKGPLAIWHRRRSQATSRT